MSGLDIRKAVEKDIARGETRFFIHTGFEGQSLYAPGIKACAQNPDAPTRDLAVAGFRAPDRNKSVSDFECASAIVRFQGHYNQELARMLPKTLSGNCPYGRGKIDASFTTTNIPAYRKRIETAKRASRG